MYELDDETKKSAAFDILSQFLQTSGEKIGGELLKAIDISDVTEIVSSVAIETGVGIIPILGNAYASIKQKKKIRRLEKLFELLQKRVDNFIERVETASFEDKEKYSELIDFAFESAQYYSQEEKIEFLANGLTTIIQIDNVSFDISYLYINTLNRLTLLDIAILKLYNKPRFYNEGEYKEFEFNTYEDILDKFNITVEQYRSVQANLGILGLLETKTNQVIEKDLDAIENQITRIDNNIKNIHSDLNKIINNKNIRNVSTIKNKKERLKNKNRYTLSKFGREFYKYFIED